MLFVLMISFIFSNREQLNCSLALVSDSLSSVEQGFQISNRSRGYSYVVGVTDTQNSWSAFQVSFVHFSLDLCN